MPQLTVSGHNYDIQAILLDKDGTLLDFIYTWGRWGEHLLARFSRKLVSRKLQPLEDGMLHEWGMRCDEQGVLFDYDRNGPLAMGTVGDLLTLLTREGYRRGLSWAEAKRLAETSRHEADERLEQERAARLLPGVSAFLRQCCDAGIRLGVVTADETEAAEKHLEWTGIRHYFEVCVGTDRVERGKPFPDMLEAACDRLGVSSRHIAVIGDTNADMMMARAAGAIAIGIDMRKGGGGGGLPDADAAIGSYGELALHRGH